MAVVTGMEDTTKLQEISDKSKSSNLTHQGLIWHLAALNFKNVQLYRRKAEVKEKKAKFTKSRSRPHAAQRPVSKRERWQEDQVIQRPAILGRWSNSFFSKAVCGRAQQHNMLSQGRQQGARQEDITM